MQSQKPEEIQLEPQGQYDRWKYPFDKMGIGDSFFVVKSPGDTFQRVQSRVISAAKRYQKSTGQPVKVKTAKAVKDGKEGVRAWLILDETADYLDF